MPGRGGMWYRRGGMSRAAGMGVAACHALLVWAWGHITRCWYGRGMTTGFA